MWSSALLGFVISTALVTVCMCISAAVCMCISATSAQQSSLKQLRHSRCSPCCLKPATLHPCSLLPGCSGTTSRAPSQITTARPCPDWLQTAGAYRPASSMQSPAAKCRSTQHACPCHGRRFRFSPQQYTGITEACRGAERRLERRCQPAVVQDSRIRAKPKRARKEPPAMQVWTHGRPRLWMILSRRMR